MLLADYSVARQQADPADDSCRNRFESAPLHPVEKDDASLPSRQSGLAQIRGRPRAPRRIHSSRDARPVGDPQRASNETLAAIVARGGTLLEGSAAIKRLLEAGGSPTARTFTQLMSVCAHQIRHGGAGLGDAYKVLELARSCGVAPDLILYNGLMSCCAKAALRGRAGVADGGAVLREMRAARTARRLIEWWGAV